MFYCLSSAFLSMIVLCWIVSNSTVSSLIVSCSILLSLTFLSSFVLCWTVS